MLLLETQLTTELVKSRTLEENLQPLLSKAAQFLTNDLDFVLTPEICEFSSYASC